jgi:3-oxoadipate enol-lactonase
VVGTDEYDSRIAIQGQGDPLVLVPGMDGTGALFYRQVPLLSRAYRVATYALRDAARSMDVLVADLERVIDQVAPNRQALVIGESFGGALAMSFALACPTRVAGLVIVNSFRVVPQARLRLAIGGLRAMPWGAMALVRRLTAFRLHSRHTHRTEIRRFLAVSSHIRKEGYLGRLEILRTYDVRERLSTIAVPTLFIASDRDHLVPSLREARQMAARVPGSRLEVLEGHGHICLIAPNVDLEAIVTGWRNGARIGPPTRCEAVRPV